MNEGTRRSEREITMDRLEMTRLVVLSAGLLLGVLLSVAVGLLLEGGVG